MRLLPPDHEATCRRRWKIYSSIQEIAWRKPTPSNKDAADEAMNLFVDAYLTEPTITGKTS